ncbi:hypothetical protein EV14_0693 [Prochlorococcus sp. MIT 0703]|nr:hypothetical protein EV12_0701 [Prochlorococcus sp. MIT 0701]KGG35899.1 hypothetical protein EV14_0693 [Prochlorococcus sp. MIT 0703]
MTNSESTMPEAATSRSLPVAKAPRDGSHKRFKARQRKKQSKRDAKQTRNSQGKHPQRLQPTHSNQWTNISPLEAMLL